MTTEYVTLPTLPPDIRALILGNLFVIEVISMFAIGAYSALEVGIASLDLFKRHRGLYFFSMQVASWGIILHALPAQIYYVTNSAILPLSVPFLIGWCCMVTGQPLVLYSRLHLVVADITRLRWVLWMIIFNGVTMYIPIVVLFYGLALGKERFVLPSSIFNKIQIVVFAAQDLIICVIYIREAHRALGPVIAIRGKEGKRVIIHLIAINVVVILMNAVLVAAEFKTATIQVGLKTVVYSQKLKFEFSVLNKLRSLVSSHNPYIFHPHTNRALNQNSSNRNNEENDTSLRRRSSDLNIFALYAMISGDSRTSRRDIESIAPDVSATTNTNATITSNPNSNSNTITLEQDPFINRFQQSMQNYESRRTRQRMSQMGSTPDFHQVIRETSSNENMPASPAPTMVSFTPGSSPGYFCEHVCGSDIDADADTRDRIGSLGTGTSSTFVVESPPLK